MGTLMVAISAVRFIVTERRIDSEEIHRGGGSRFDIVLALLLVMLGCFLAIYLSHALVATP
jgi:hypothetical protein